MGMRYLDISQMVSGYNPRRNYTSAQLAGVLTDTTWE